LSRIRVLVFIAVLYPTFAFSLDKPIIAPEHREAAQKRQAELVRQRFCTDKAGKEKVTKRDLAPFIVGCMDEVERAEQAIKK
jgi:hypothetical protein